MTRLRGRRPIICTDCHKHTTTRHATETRCLQCRARGKNLADRRPDPRGKPGPKRSIGRMSKHEIDEWIDSGGAA